MASTGQDSTIRFRCECGSVLTARASLSGRKGKCKTCGTVQVIPPPEESLGADEAPEKATGIQEMCSVCQTGIEDGDDRTTCNVCQLPFHEECWEENLGCSAYGCTNVNALKDGPDIRVALMPAAPMHTLGRPPAAAEEEELHIDHLLLAARALATGIGFVTCGVPTLMVAVLAIWRMVVNNRDGESLALPLMSLLLCGGGLLVGLCLSAGFWMS